jgi:hypothetical protein
VLTAQVESLQDKTCNCKEGPVLVGQGTADVPFELEYADEVVLPSPNPSSYATPPVENAVSVPIPTPAPASTLAESDKENCRRCPLQPVSQLVKIEDEVMEVDRAEDAPRVAEVRPVVTGQRGKHSRCRVAHHMAPSAYPYSCPVESDGDQSGRDEGRPFQYRVNRPNRQVELEVQLRHLTQLTVQDPAQASDEGDGGSLFDYVDSAAEQSPGDGDVGPSVPKFSDIWAAGGTLRRHLFVST